MMQQGEKNQVLVDSLLAMKNSLLSSYEMKTTVKEEGLLLRGLTKEGPEYIVFSDYRRNDGRRRILDAIEMIDNAIYKLENMDYRNASKVYLDTLKSVAIITKMANVLECHCLDGNFKEKEEEGPVTLRVA